MYTYLTRYSYCTCRADSGSQAWAEVKIDQAVSGIGGLRLLKSKILEQRGDGAEVFIKDFKLVDKD